MKTVEGVIALKNFHKKSSGIIERVLNAPLLYAQKLSRPQVSPKMP